MSETRLIDLARISARSGRLDPQLVSTGGLRLASNRVAVFFGLVSVLTAPLWALGAFVNYDFLPGLPIAALAVMCPALAAGILTLRAGGRTSLIALLKRAVDFRGARRWVLPTILINPVLFGLAFVVSRFLGADILLPQFSLISTIALFALFLPTAMLEELGWSGYALDRLQIRLSPRMAAVLLGVLWALWHIPTLVQAGRSLEWIAWWSVWTVSARLVMVWLYNWAGKSVTAVALYHATSNLCWQLYPVNGSHFDPRVSGLITFALAVALMTWRDASPQSNLPE
jgi:membrane protease YdiL (CAAX protease family)